MYQGVDSFEKCSFFFHLKILIVGYFLLISRLVCFFRVAICDETRATSVSALRNSNLSLEILDFHAGEFRDKAGRECELAYGD